jgi:hypothetical protein
MLRGHSPLSGRGSGRVVYRPVSNLNESTRGTLTTVDSLKRHRNEEIKSTLQREIGKQLHAMYDPVAKDELPPRLEELMLRIDERLH